MKVVIANVVLATAAPVVAQAAPATPAQPVFRLHDNINALDGDPMSNVRELESVNFVRKHGSVDNTAGQRQLTKVN